MTAAVITHAQRRLRRFQNPSRIAGLDLARGLAVLGMYAAHLVSTTPFDFADPSTWTDIVNGRSSILFAVLAGVSLSLVTGGNNAARSSIARAPIFVRGLLLWALGLAVLALEPPVLVILPTYGLLFVVAAGMIRLRTAALIGIATAAVFIGPAISLGYSTVFVFEEWLLDLENLIGWHYPLPIWIAFLTAGMVLGRMQLRRVSSAVVIVAGGAVAAVIGYGAGWLTEPLRMGDGTWLIASYFSAGPHTGGVGEVIGSGGVAFAVIGLCLLLCRTPARYVLLPLRFVGSMPLTAYVGHIVVWVVLMRAMGIDSHEFDVFVAMDPFWYFAIAAMVFCSLWALFIGRGPLEWVLTAATNYILRAFAFFGNGKSDDEASVGYLRE